MTNPTLFYYWIHDKEYNRDEFETQTLEGLIKRADVIFREFFEPRTDIVDEIEKDLNNYLLRRELSEKLRLCLAHKNRLFDEDRYLYPLVKDTGKRFAFERLYQEYDGDMDQEDKESDLAFFKYPIQTAMQIKAEFLAKYLAFHVRRERDVIDQILAIPETVLVIFGLGHKGMEELVTDRPTEIHYPEPNYRLHYQTIRDQIFRITGQLDKDSYLRELMETISRSSINKKYGNNLTPKELTKLSLFYADKLTQEQIIEFGEYANRCSRLGFSTLDTFESFLKKDRLQLPEQAFKELFGKELKEQPRIIVFDSSKISPGCFIP